MEQVITKKKVLIVDDEPNVRRLSRTILSKNFDIIEAEDGKQAVEIANIQNPGNSDGYDDAQDGWTNCLPYD